MPPDWLDAPTARILPDWLEVPEIIAGGSIGSRHGWVGSGCICFVDKDKHPGVVSPPDRLCLTARIMAIGKRVPKDRSGIGSGDLGQVGSGSIGFQLKKSARHR